MAGECPSMLSNKHRMSMTPQIGAFPFLRGTTPTNYCANPYFLTDGYEDLARDVIHQFESTTSRFHTLVDRATRVIELENISRDYNEAFEIPPLAAIDYEISCHGSGRRLVQAIPKYCATMGSLSLMFIRESLMIFGILLEEKTREYANNCSLMLALAPQARPPDDEASMARIRQFSRGTCQRLAAAAIDRLATRLQDAAEELVVQTRLPKMPVDSHNFSQRFQNAMRQGATTWYGAVSMTIATEQRAFMVRYEMALDTIFAGQGAP